MTRPQPLSEDEELSFRVQPGFSLRERPDSVVLLSGFARCC